MTVKIILTGDFCPVGRVGRAIQSNQTNKLFKGIDDVLLDSDICVVDLECPLTRSNNPIVKTGPHLKGDPAAAAVLRELGCTLVATANNHFKDFGREGMEDTFDCLRRNKLGWVGSGSSLKEAIEPKIIKADGMSVAILNMTENEWSTTLGCDPGCAPIDFPEALRAIKRANILTDYVLVILHGGHEHYNLPSPRIQQQFRFMIDAGADAVVGHHSHTISGYELYKKRHIFYSLGNFCIDMPEMRSDAWCTGLVLQLEVTKHGLVEFKLIPIRQNDDFVGVRLLDNKASVSVLGNIEELSEIISDSTELGRRFENYCESRASILLSQIQPYTNPILMALHRRNLIPGLLSGRKRKLLAALCQCESHRDVLLHALKRSL